MFFKTISLVLFTIFPLSQLAFGDIAKTCELEQPFSDFGRDLQSMKELVCPEIALHSDEEFQSLGATILNIAQEINIGTASGSLSANDIENLNWELDDSLYTLRDLLNGFITTDEKPRSDAPIANNLRNLFDQYSDESSRVTNKDQYINDIFEIINQTQSGEGLVDCFLNNSNPKIKGSNIVFETEYNGYDASFHLDSNEDGSEFTKVLTFNPAMTEPNLAIQLIAHELQHACAGDSHIHQHNQSKSIFAKRVEVTSELSAISDPIDEERFGTTEMPPERLSFHNDAFDKREEYVEAAAEPSDELINFFSSLYGDKYIELLNKKRKLLKHQEESDREAARVNSLDEIRGFHRQTEVYEEIARYLPQSFCSPKMIDNFYQDVISIGQVHSNIQVDIESGTFLPRLLDQYLTIEQSGYTRDSFYQITSEGDEVLIPEYQQQVDELILSLEN